MAKSRFVLCISSGQYPASLEARKLYRRVPDESAELRGLMRVIDESGDDYLYPRDLFMSVPLPAPAIAALLAG